MSQLPRVTPPATKKTNLDADYHRHAKQFTRTYQQLPQLQKQLEQSRQKLIQLESLDMMNMSSQQIDEYHRIRNEVSSLEKEVKDAENLTDMTQFYLKTGHLLIDYYDNIENKEERKDNISKYFKSVEPCPTTEQKQNKDITDFVKTNHRVNRADLYHQYLTQVDPHYLATAEHTVNDEYCGKCNRYRELINSEAIMVCPGCGDQVEMVMDSDKPSYKDPPNENMYFAYKRSNHFKEQLSHFQAKETTQIPNEVYEAIIVELKKEKKTNLSSLTRAKVRKYLQKYSHLGYNKYYENINQIICNLNGIPPLSMPPEVEDQLCNMFQKIQEPFERHCPADRTNFLSYAYVIHKFCQLLGYVEYLPYFNLLKSRDKLHQQDKIWKKICGDLGWKYYSSAT